MFKEIFNKNVLVSDDLRVFLDSREGIILPHSQVSDTAVTTWMTASC